MKRILAVAALLLAGLVVPYTATASRPLDTVRAYSWGDSYFGQLGVGLIGIATSPVEVDQTAPFTQIDSGERHSCALDAKGRAWCWGNGASGQLGTGLTTDSNIPVMVDRTGVLAGTELIDIAVGIWGSCAVDTKGHGYCWGYGNSGQLGNGSNGDSAVPVAVDTAGVLDGKELIDITMGGLSTCAVDAAGKAYCWGGNYAGQLGTGDTTSSNVPREVDTTGALDGVLLNRIDLGGGHACALDTLGHGYCWGGNYSGQLGDDTTTSSSVAVKIDTSVQPEASELAGISAGSTHTCAVNTTGTAFCWGDGWWGQLGRNSTANSSSPVPVVNLSSAVVSIAAGNSFTCAATSETGTFCWGTATEGMLGSASVDKALVPRATPVPGTVHTVAAGLNHGCALNTDDQAYCWGSGGAGQLGDGRVSSTSTPSPVPWSATELAAGRGHSCAITQDGSVLCTGNGEQGQLGNGAKEYRAAPVAVSLPGRAAAIAAGEAHTCALVNGAAYCWGDGNYGQLGNPNTRGSQVPVPVSTSGVLAGQRLVGITAGGFHTCAVDEKGTAYCWGRNAEGELGNGGNTQAYEPVSVDFTAYPSVRLAGITAGQQHTCAWDVSGTAYCWGDNYFGQLGSGDTVSVTIPVPVTNGQAFSTLSAGYFATCGISNSVAYCWGSNSYAQLGTGDMVQRLVPAAVQGLSGTSVQAISMGTGHACAAADGDFYCWGMNSYGALGSATDPYVTSAIIVPGTEGPPSALACGHDFTIAATSEPPPASAPDPPTVLSGSAGDGQVQLTWKPPDWDGGSAITGYTVTGAPGGSCATTENSCRVNGLTNGTGYTFTVTATNALGTSAASAPTPVLTPFAPSPSASPTVTPSVTPTVTPSVTPTVTPSVTPGPVGPVSLRVKVRRHRAVVRWSRAVDATTYQIKVRKPGRHFTAWRTTTKRKSVVHGLRPAKRYVVRVRAVGPAGFGPATTLRFRAKG